MFYMVYLQQLNNNNNNNTAVSSQPSLTASNPEVIRMVREIRNRAGLNLFGVDVILDNSTHVPYAIDLNMFPGWSCVKPGVKL